MKAVRRHEPRGFEEDLEREHEERRQVGVALEKALAQRPALADDAEAYQANEQKIRGLHSELQRRELVIRRREQDLERALKQAEHAAFRKAWRAVEAAAEAQTTEAARLAKHLQQADSSAGKLEQLRTALDEKLAAAKELRPDDVGELPDLPDAPWPEKFVSLRRVLKDGPRQPRATAERAAARRAADTRRSENAVIAQAVKDALVSGTFGRLERLPAELRACARRVAEREAETKLAELDAEARGENVIALSGPPDRQREAIRRRLERIRGFAEPSRQVVESTGT